MNLKKYLGKNRIYKQVTGFPRIQRIYVWDPEKNRYDPPPHGDAYRAHKRIYRPDGSSKRIYKNFASTDHALRWQSSGQLDDQQGGAIFREVVELWRMKKLPKLRHSTRIAYEKMLRLYFEPLMDTPMKQFNSRTVDWWIDHLKDPNEKFMKAKRRIKFDHELDLLSGILRYYREYKDESFSHPIMRRHREDIKTGRKKPIRDKNILPNQFFLFRDYLRKRKNGKVFACLATVQYFQALRISEAAAIHAADVILNRDTPSRSRLFIRREVIYPRIKGEASYIEVGFKNSEVNGGVKEQPLFPESFEAVKEMESARNGELLFSIEGEHLEYRQIEHAYNQAFKAAGLPFSGTHVMRHGGTRRVYRQTKNLETAKQVLGNSDLQTVLVYAKADANELTAFAEKEWEQYESPISTDIKRG